MHAKSHQWCTSRARSMVEAQRWRARPGIPDLCCFERERMGHATSLFVRLYCERPCLGFVEFVAVISRL